LAGLALQVAFALALQAGESPSAGWKNGPPTDPGFFPIAVWLQNPRNAPAYKAAGINTYVALWRGPTAEQIDALKASGMKLVCRQNALALSRKDDSTIIAWMHNDEPDNAQSKPGGGYGPPVAPEKIIEDYGKVRAADPTRPVLLNLGQGVAWDGWVGRGVRTNHPEDYDEYVKGCDIASFDIYPAVHDRAEIAGKLWYVPKGVERLRQAGKGAKIVWNCIEASRIDNEKVKPTPAQIRAEVWMSIIHGSRGIVYFVHQFKPASDEASLLRDPELLKGVTEINRQVLELAPAINGATVEGVLTATTPDPQAPVAAVLKRHGGATYVFAVAMREKGGRAAFALKDGAKEGVVERIGGAGTLTLKDGRFEDEFQPYEVRLYRIR
jgi:hypothetical protein